MPLGAGAEGARTPLWREAAAILRRAAGNSERAHGHRVVFMTSFVHFRINYLKNFFKHADRLGFLDSVVAAPLHENVTGLCRQIAEMVVEPGREATPCLPFISQFWPRVQLLYLHVALQLDLVPFWFDFHVMWVQSPWPWVKRALGGEVNQPPYHSHCRPRCASALQPEIFMAEDFYAEYVVKTSLVLLRPTEGVKAWLETLGRWISDYPFGSAVRAWQYLAQPDRPDDVPSVSMLPAPERMPRVVLGEMDVEQEFVSYDGFYGRADAVVTFEVSGFMAELDRQYVLEKFMGGTAAEVQDVVLRSRKTLSPMRPTQRLYERLEIEAGAPPKCEWQHAANAYIGGFAAGVEEAFERLEDAQCHCARLGPACGGVTCDGPGDGAGSPPLCTLRAGDPPLAQSPIGEESYVQRCPDGGCDAPPIERIVHVNFADGCCEVEQKQSSDTAQQFGADESRPLRGDFLDDEAGREFRRRNHHLLTFNRTPELTQHKTPSGKIGYYVWKPYVVLQTVLDPSLPYDTTVIAWTDAGIHFVSDLGPLVQKYMPFTDVSATRTPMMEGDFSKRDAFVLLDADYQTIMETNQIATGVILVRKTQLAISFLQAWLRACEDPRIMTEELLSFFSLLSSLPHGDAPYCVGPLGGVEAGSEDLCV